MIALGVAKRKTSWTKWLKREDLQAFYRKNVTRYGKTLSATTKKASNSMN